MGWRQTKSDQQMRSKRFEKFEGKSNFSMFSKMKLGADTAQNFRGVVLERYPRLNEMYFKKVFLTRRLFTSISLVQNLLNYKLYYYKFTVNYVFK